MAGTPEKQEHFPAMALSDPYAGTPVLPAPATTFTSLWVENMETLQRLLNCRSAA
jgi:hypothetical protein